MASEEDIDRAMIARLLTVVATLYLLLVFYGSWVPLHFTPRSLPWLFQTFAALPFFDQTISSAADWATNLLLLIPFSFLLAQRVLPRQRGIADLASRFALIGFCVALAFTLEFSQLFFPPRIVSQQDILALSLGAIIGIAAQHRWGNKVENWLAMLWQRENQQTRLIRLLHVYLLVLFAFSVLPLDLTVSLVELYHKWREGRVLLMPFVGLKGGAFNNLYETFTDLLIWVPVGLFLTFDRNASLIRIAFAGFLAAAVIETAQLFVYSRVTDVTDVLLAGVGAAMGGWLAKRGNNSFALLAEAGAGFWFSLWVGWAIAVFCVFWFPFDFRTADVTLDLLWSAFTRVPFLLLYEGSEFQAVNEMLRKISFFLPGGILWVLGATAHQNINVVSRSNLYGILALAAVALIIEGGQLFIPGKYADLTDVILKTGGGFLGMVFTRWVLAGRNSSLDRIVPGNAAISPAELRRAAPPTQRKADPAWSNHLLTFLGLSLAVGILTRLPFMPYNVRELNSPGIAGLFSSLGLAMAIYWIANGHFHFLRWYGQDRMLALPAWLGLHGIVAWMLIRATMPMESIQDILGSPILGWPWEWELIGRYLALHAVIGMQAIGATLFVSLICHYGKISSLMIWLIFAVTLSWPLHMIVVDAAATDNLTELMRNGGSFSSSILLASGILAFFITGTAISAIFAFSGHRVKTLILATTSSVVAASAFWFGSEQVILKYGKVFSAWQFLLSTNRQSYAFGTELYMRYLAAYVLMASALGLVQVSQIKAFCQRIASSRNP